MASDEQIDYLTSDQLPRPLRDLVERAQFGDPCNATARKWVCDTGDPLARAALCQLILILACPPELMCHYNVGCDFEEAYGFVEFYGAWQSALAQAIGVPEPRVPDRLEWLERWRGTEELLKAAS